MIGEFINTKLCEITGELYNLIDAEVEGAIEPQGFVRFTVRPLNLPPWTKDVKLTVFCSIPSEEIAKIIYCDYRKHIEKQFLKGK